MKFLTGCRFRNSFLIRIELPRIKESIMEIANQQRERERERRTLCRAS